MADYEAGVVIGNFSPGTIHHQGAILVWSILVAHKMGAPDCTYIFESLTHIQKISLTLVGVWIVADFGDVIYA